MTYDIICIGMALVDSIIKGFNPEPVSASGYRALSGTLNVGGEAVNEAIAASKLGLRTAILCSLGQDNAGSMVKSALNEAGVDTSLISDGPATPVTTILVNDDGTRKSITNEAHNYHFHPEMYTAVFADTRVITLGSLFRAPFDDLEVIYSVVSAAHDAGNLIIADTKLPNFRKLALMELTDSLPKIDFITPNEDEARYFTGKEEPDAMADVFLKYGVKNVIIKLGGKGCFLKNQETSLHLPAYRIEAVDATGAGDHFVAGFVSAIIRGSSAEDALQFGNACGAICTTAIGAGTALKDEKQVMKWMGEHTWKTFS
ncbi:MAG: carbohydrate kinase family protein [Clostridia bacterium]|nr:carbohydrate kinase family protein [Clostridia bacterium]